MPQWVGYFEYSYYICNTKSINYLNMYEFMKWSDVELIDGKFYVADICSRVFAFKNDNSERFTLCHVCAKFVSSETSINAIYDGGLICHNDEIKNIRPATREDMDYFWDYLSRWGYKYSLNTKKLRYVGNR